MTQFIKVAVETLGCKLNQAESEKIVRQLAKCGCDIVSADNKPDVYILNTCTVTHIADRKARHLLRVAKQQNNIALTVAIGCYAERAADSLIASNLADVIIGNADKERTHEIVLSRFARQNPIGLSLSPARTRSFLKIQDGCSHCCSFCIVPLVRGKEKSVPYGEVISEVKQREEEKCKEIVLTGTEIGSYNFDGLNFSELLQRLLENTSIERIRVSSLQPKEINPRLLSMWEDKRLCPHFHISLQSGADMVLHRMKRPYSSASYLECIHLIRSSVPHASITTDVIVGFPGETEEEFKQTVQFCQSVGFSRIHIFPYSPRPNTKAASMPEQIPATVKKARAQRMHSLARESSKEYLSRFIGREVMVLWEYSSEGIWCGYSPEYVRIYGESEKDLSNTISGAKGKHLYKEGLWATLI